MTARKPAPTPEQVEAWPCCDHECYCPDDERDAHPEPCEHGCHASIPTPEQVEAEREQASDNDLLAQFHLARFAWEQATQARNAAEVHMNGLLLDVIGRGLDPCGDVDNTTREHP